VPGDERLLGGSLDVFVENRLGFAYFSMLVMSWDTREVHGRFFTRENQLGGSGFLAPNERQTLRVLIVKEYRCQMLSSSWLRMKIQLWTISHSNINPGSIGSGVIMF
jgi:hypothetical protein